MKKILTLLGGFNLVSLSIVGTMNTTSCFWDKKNVTSPIEPIGDFFKIQDLGDISGETELPTTKLIIELLWVKNGYSLDNDVYESEYYLFHGSCWVHWGSKFN